MQRWGPIGRLACAAIVTFSVAGAWAQDGLPPIDEPPAGEMPEDMPPEDMPPEDMLPEDMLPEDMPPEDMLPEDMLPEDMPPEDMPLDDLPPEDMPLDDLPPDLPPDDLPPYDLPPDDLPADDLPPASGSADLPPPTEPAPESTAAGSTADPAREELVEVTTSYYPDEEREFGPIEGDYRGPIELSAYMGWTVYDGRLELLNGGSLHGGLRFTGNLGAESQWGLDFDMSITRINLDISRTMNGVPVRSSGGEVTIATFMGGITYRLTGLRAEYLTPFVRVAAGVAYFDDTDTTALVGGTLQKMKLHSTAGFAAYLGLGFDYKLARNWSLRFETGMDVWYMNDWLDRSEAHVNANLANIGIVWHFD